MNADFAPKSISNMPEPGEPRNALLDSIRKGTTLKVICLMPKDWFKDCVNSIVLMQKVEQTQVTNNTSNNGDGDSRNDLLSEIRQGVELRPAATRELGAQRESSGAGTDALADALRRALQERGRVLRSSDDESDSSENDGEWDD